ncbi:transferase family protein [Aspergillus clavatus NRRL 1]|uniref:Transferase family protein n=1 Tax=Aspergillus clavatus (strain ATCC 1007 / CBS 513.65 / DSM 816 / NCTC 3887 / NRRL 1 / QM 1276 / 107) TaxID=344612 RepID=A1CD15_ASPCL|nr:transferase family protein [Aspergillus clavatus NRRL 1]EAW12422.1 transferase family protein [Aspergillus clavatus NRRL 1]
MHQFSPLDAIMPPIFNALIVGWSCPDDGHDSLGSVLQRSLALVLEEWPDLAGEIVAPPADAPPRTQPTIRPLGELGSPLTICDFTGPDSPFPYSYAQLQAQGFPTSKLDGQLLAPLAGVATTQRVMAAQANFIPGGCLLSVGVSHQFTDAYGVYLIFEKWAQYCRQFQGLPAQPAAFPPAPSQPQTSLPPVLQVSHDQAAEQYPTLKQRPELWKLIGLDWRGSATSPPPEPPFQLAAGGAETCIFSLSVAAQATLKRAASAFSSSSPSPISTNDALVAWIWRTISKARFPTGQPNAPYRDNSYVSVAIDGRRPLSIPADYAGNVVFCSMTNMPIHELTNPDTPLGEIAARIRQETTANRDPARLQEAVALAAGIPHVRQPLANAFPSWFAEDLVTTSWVGLPFYQLDFGPALGSSGRIDTFRMPRGQFAGICSFQPRADDGSVEMVVGLLAEQMERLVADPDFAQFVTLVSS